MQTYAGPSHSPPAAPAAAAAASSQQHADTEMSAEDGLAQHSPAAESVAPQPAPAAACARSQSPPAPSAPGQWTPLLDWIVLELVNRAGAPSREAALEALHVDSLVCLPNLHTYLNDLLRHKKVVHSLRDVQHAFSCVSAHLTCRYQPGNELGCRVCVCVCPVCVCVCPAVHRCAPSWAACRLVTTSMARHTWASGGGSTCDIPERLGSLPDQPWCFIWLL